MPEFDPKQAIKGMTEAIKGWGDIQGERSKIMASMLSNELKAKQNFFYKLQQQRTQQRPMEQMLQHQQAPQAYLSPRTGAPDPTISAAGGRMGYPSAPPRPFEEASRPQIRMGRKGLLEARTPTGKQWVYNRILEKQKRGFDLTEKEKKFKENYLGMGEKEKKLTQSQRKIIGMIRRLKERNASIGDIEEAISYEGYDPEDFFEEIGEYERTPGFFEELKAKIFK